MSAFDLLIQALLALGLGQGVFLCVQLWRLRQRNPFGYGHLLIALAAVLAVLVEQWLVYAGLWRQWPHLLRVTVWMPFLFGPGLWLFVQSLQRPTGRWRDAVHYFPALVGLAWFLPFLLQSGADKLAFVAATHSIPLESSVFGLAKAVSLFAYVIAIRLQLRQSAAGGEDRLRRRFARACSAFLVFLTGLWLLFVAEHLWGDLGLPSDVVAALGLALFFYAASVIAVAHWRDFALSLAPVAKKLETSSSDAERLPTTAPRREGLLDADSTATLFQHVRSEVLAQSLFREPGLKIDDLAQRLGLATHYLSYVINAEAGHNVQAWLNGLRVQAAQQALRAPGDDSILDIGLAAGFNSKASFNRAFKAATGQSPSDYRAAHRAQTAN